MINNFSHLGFFSSDGDFTESLSLFIEQVRTKSPLIKEGNINKIEYSDTSGAEVKILVNQNNSLVTINPYFKGSSVFNAKISSSVYSDEYHEGGFMAEAVNEEQFPFYFNYKDIYEERKRHVPFDCNLQLSLFPKQIKVFTDKEDPEFKKLIVGERSFISSGLFNEEGRPTPRPECVLSGIVKEVIEHTNALTGLPFLEILIATVGGDMDVLVEPKALNLRPLQGQIIFGLFWMSGRMIG